MKWVPALFLLLPAFLAPTLHAPAQAAPLPAHPGARAGMIRQAMEELGLTRQQRRQLTALRRDRRLEQTRLAQEVRLRRRALAELYRSYPLDEARASALIQQIAQAESALLRLQLQNQLDLRRILTRDQFVRFTQIIEPSRRPPLSIPSRASGP
jgi:Spy/CpxP family protein refolding chaperone